MAQRDQLPHVSLVQQRTRESLSALLACSPIPDAELPKNLPLYLPSETLADVLACALLFQRVLEVPGDIVEFGVRWGRRLALFIALRELLEPHNHTRRVLGFDTFTGFPDVCDADGPHPAVRPGGFTVTPGHVDHLVGVLETHEGEGPWGHVQRFDVIPGDVRETVPAYLEQHPECLISLAYFDLDVYEPTRACLEAVLGRMTRGSVIAFDQLGQVSFPGETRAVREVLSIADVRLLRFSFHPSPLFLVR